MVHFLCASAGYLNCGINNNFSLLSLLVGSLQGAGPPEDRERIEGKPDPHAEAILHMAPVDDGQRFTGGGRRCHLGAYGSTNRRIASGMPLSGFGVII
jgi:hypothetical protein